MIDRREVRLRLFELVSDGVMDVNDVIERVEQLEEWVWHAEPEVSSGADGKSAPPYPPKSRN